MQCLNSCLLAMRINTLFKANARLKPRLSWSEIPWNLLWQVNRYILHIHLTALQRLTKCTLKVAVLNIKVLKVVIHICTWSHNTVIHTCDSRCNGCQWQFLRCLKNLLVLKAVMGRKCSSLNKSSSLHGICRKLHLVLLYIYILVTFSSVQDSTVSLQSTFSKAFLYTVLTSLITGQ